MANAFDASWRDGRDGGKGKGKVEPSPDRPQTIFTAVPLTATIIMPLLSPITS